MTSPRRARAGLGSARLGASTFGHERRYVRRRGEKALSEQRGPITQGPGVHTRVLSSNRSATRTRPLFINLPELELRAAQDKPPGLLVLSPRSPPSAQPSSVLGHFALRQFAFYLLLISDIGTHDFVFHPVYGEYGKTNTVKSSSRSLPLDFSNL